MTTVRMALADLRESWTAWLAVSLAFVATNAAVGLSWLAMHSGLAAVSAGTISDEDAPLVMADGSLNLVLCTLVALAVVGTSTSLVVGSRRGSIARLALAGAAPGRLVGLLMVQLGLVALACSVVGDLVAVLSQPWVLHSVAADRSLATPEALVSPAVLVGSSLYCAAIAMVGGLRQARRATRISPVEALRSAAGAPRRPARWWVVALRWLGFAASIGGIVAALVGFRVAAHELGDDAMSTVSQLAFLTLPVVGLALVLVAPYVVVPLTLAWTRLLPVPGVSWHLARRTVAARAERLTTSVVPVMFAVGLLTGMMTLSATLVATLRANGADFELDGATVTTVLTTVGLPLVIAVAGSVGNLAMMSRQRDAELALAGVIGATPAQQRLLPALEATMVVGTAGLLGLAMAAASGAVLASGLHFAVPVTAMSMPVGLLVWVLLGSWLVTVLATTVPSLPALRRPAPAVISRLVAD